MTVNVGRGRHLIAVIIMVSVGVLVHACKPKAGSTTKSYDAFVNQQRTAQECWMTESDLANLAQTNSPLHQRFTKEWDDSLSVVRGRLTPDSDTTPESLAALRRVWLATPASIRSLFTAPESDAKIRLVTTADFPARCAPPTRGTATGEAVDLQACWRIESLAGSAPAIVLTLSADPAVIHRVFIPSIVATVMETRLQANNPALASMQGSLIGSLRAMGDATVADLEVSEKGRGLLNDFQKRFGVADKAQLSASVPFQILALAELLDAAYCSRETYDRFTLANDLPMPKSVAAINQLATSDPAQTPWFLRKGSSVH